MLLDTISRTWRTGEADPVWVSLVVTAEVPVATLEVLLGSGIDESEVLLQSFWTILGREMIDRSNHFADQYLPTIMKSAQCMNL